jgi:CRISPR/Cas system CSM-associated protein Csm2 small subunit
MGNIVAIAEIAKNRKKAKEIVYRVQNRGHKTGEKFGDILQEEIDKLNKEKATKELGKATSVEN